MNVGKDQDIVTAIPNPKPNRIAAPVKREPVPVGGR